MSMNSVLIEKLKLMERKVGGNGDVTSASLLQKAIDTIEEQAEKIHVLNMERSAAHFNNGWIPCNERLPGEKGLYIVTIYNGLNGTFDVDTDIFNLSCGSWGIDEMYSKDDFLRLNVVAWMPMPKMWEG